MDIIHIETCKNYDNKECDLGRSHKNQIATVIAVLKRLKQVIILFRKTNYTSNKECDLGRSHKKRFHSRRLFSNKIATVVAFLKL